MNRAEYRSVARCYGKEAADMTDAEISFLNQTNKALTMLSRKEFIRSHDTAVKRAVGQHGDFKLYYPYKTKFIRWFMSVMFRKRYIDRIIKIMNFRAIFLNKIRSGAITRR